MGNGQPGFGSGANFRPGTPVKKIGGMDAKDASDKILRWAEKADTREKLLDILVPYIRVRGIQYIDEWHTRTISAKSDAHAQPEPETEAFWAIALLGNLVWAASCFVPGAGVVKAVEGVAGMTKLGKVFYSTMQVGGGLAAAGTLEKIIASNSSGEPTGKDWIADGLDEERKKIKDKFEDNITKFAGELVRQDKFQPEVYERDRNKFLKTVDRVLWESIFPSDSFEDLSTFYHNALKIITGALSEFNRQYKMWSEAKRRYALAGEPHYGYADYKTAGQDYEKRLNEFVRRRPFKPLLNLDMRPAAGSES